MLRNQNDKSTDKDKTPQATLYLPSALANQWVLIFATVPQLPARPQVPFSFADTDFHDDRGQTGNERGNENLRCYLVKHKWEEV